MGASYFERNNAVCCAAPMERSILLVMARRKAGIRGKTSTKPMRTGKWRKTLAICVGLVSIALICASAAEIRYSLTELRGPNSPATHAFEVNRRGEVIGIYYGSDNRTFYSFVYRDGALRDLGSPTGYENNVGSINNEGQIVGTFIQLPITIFNWFGYLRGSDGSVATLGSLVSAIETEPESINDSGVIVGASRDLTSLRAFIYQNGQISALGSFAGHQFTRATCINNRGQILAWYATDDGTDRTVLYYRGQMQDIGLFNGSHDTEGIKINEHGVILGAYTKKAGELGYFLYSCGHFRPVRGEFSGLFGLNNSGQMVGRVVGAEQIAVLTNGVQTEDLNAFIDPKAGVHLVSANDINDAGQICADGTNASGISVGFILTPIKRCFRDR
jgi:probable HAF family extracellular repeat protein